MWRRSLLELSSHESLKSPRQILPQVRLWKISPCISTRKEFSSAPKQNLKSQPTSEPPKTGNLFPKVVFGSVAIGAAVFAAYQTGYLDQLTSSEERDSSVKPSESVILKGNSDHAQPLVVQKLDPSHREETEKLNPVREETEKLNPVREETEKLNPVREETEKLNPVREETENLNPITESTEQKVETDADLPHLEALGEEQADSQIQFQDNSSMVADENTKENDLPDVRQSSELDDKNLVTKAQEDEGVQITTVSTQTNAAPEQIEIRVDSHGDIIAEDKPEDVNAIGEGIEKPNPLLETYHLKDEADKTPLGSLGKDEINKSNKETEALIAEIEELNDGYISEDGKLVIDFLQAIHAAEKRQAELDARVFAEEKRTLKEKLEKELRDARVRELMHAEEAAMLDKELKRERAKAAAALKSLQEKLEEKFQKELEQKENEGESKLKNVQDMAKAELLAAIASEKAAQIEKMTETDLNINALCMAFYARSEEAHQSHSSQKLALGALALEDALSRGLPIQAEIEALRTDLPDVDKDSNLELVLSSIPEEILKHGSDTLLQMNQKFDALKTPLRHFSLIPPGGGGILTHSLARVASWIKVREVDQSGYGIESVINKVESYLAEGNLAEAAHSLEEGVKGTKAAEAVGDWVREARNRAITEQALTLLQLYASSISLS